MPVLPRRPTPLVTDFGHDHVRFVPVPVTKIRDKPALRRCGGGPMLGRMPDNEAVAGPGLLGSGYGDVLWEPSPEAVKRARITGYRRWLAARGVSAGGTAAGESSPAAAAARDYGRLWQ